MDAKARILHVLRTLIQFHQVHIWIEDGTKFYLACLALDI